MQLVAIISAIISSIFSHSHSHVHCGRSDRRRRPGRRINLHQSAGASPRQYRRALLWRGRCVANDNATHGRLSGHASGPNCDRRRCGLCCCCCCCSDTNGTLWHELRRLNGATGNCHGRCCTLLANRRRGGCCSDRCCAECGDRGRRYCRTGRQTNVGRTVGGRCCGCNGTGTGDQRRRAGAGIRWCGTANFTNVQITTYDL